MSRYSMNYTRYDQYCTAFASTPTPHALYAIGARFPQELLERVLCFVQRTAYWCTRESYDLGQLALTCRYWAVRCQSVIFETIALRSRKDLDQLISFLDSPLSRVANYIKGLYLWQSGRPTSPWIHLISLQLVPKLFLHPYWSIQLDLDQSAASRRFRSIHDALPKVHPSFSSHFSSLYLSNICFLSFNDLVHLVDEVLSLRSLQCREVKWPTVPETHPVVLPRRRIPSHLSQVRMEYCIDQSACLRVLTGSRRKAQGEVSPLDFGLGDEQQCTVHRILLAFMDGREECAVEFEKIDTAYNRILCKNNTYNASLSFILTSVTEHNSPARIEAIAIDLCEHNGGPWKWLNQLCEDVLPLQKTVFGFRVKEDMASFLREGGNVNTNMDNVHSVGKLKYAIFQTDEGDWAWLRARPGSDVLKETVLERKDLWRV